VTFYDVFSDVHLVHMCCYDVFSNVHVIYMRCSIMYLESVRFAEKLWLKILFVDLL
jgi:hypothetical protein